MGLRRIEREMDVTKYIRSQLILTAILKALTTKQERIFLKHNYRFMIGDDEETSTTSESESDGYQTDFVTSEFKIGKNLLNDVKKKFEN